MSDNSLVWILIAVALVVMVAVAIRTQRRSPSPDDVAPSAIDPSATEPASGRGEQFANGRSTAPGVQAATEHLSPAGWIPEDEVSLDTSDVDDYVGVPANPEDDDAPAADEDTDLEGLSTWSALVAEHDASVIDQPWSGSRVPAPVDAQTIDVETTDIETTDIETTDAATDSPEGQETAPPGDVPGPGYDQSR